MKILYNSLICFGLLLGTSSLYSAAPRPAQALTVSSYTVKCPLKMLQSSDALIAFAQRIINQLGLVSLNDPVIYHNDEPSVQGYTIIVHTRPRTTIIIQALNERQECRVDIIGPKSFNAQAILLALAQ